MKRFPIFDENYRSVLETKILRHYYTREIGFETVGLWKHYLKTKLNEIMPKYNKLYEASIVSTLFAYSEENLKIEIHQCFYKARISKFILIDKKTLNCYNFLYLY